MDEEIPIVCTLSDKELQERRKNILVKIAASLIDSRELPRRFSLSFYN